MFTQTAEVPVRVDALAWLPYNPGKYSTYNYVRKFGGGADGSEDKKGNAAVVRGDLMGVPRGLILPGRFNASNDCRVVYTPMPIMPKMPARNAEQAECIAQSAHLLSQGMDHILEAPTGTGKTYMGSSVACKMGQPTLIVATKTDIMEQWRSTLVNLIGASHDDIGHVQADRCDFRGKRFILSMVQSVAKWERYAPEFYNYPGMILFDECHKLGAEFFAQACQQFPAALRLGLSATTKRTDGMFPLITAHIGPVKVKMTTVPMKPKVIVCKTGWSIPRHSVWDEALCANVDKPIPHQAGRMQTVYAAMRNSQQRNNLIANFSAACYAKGRNVVMMSDSIDHLKAIFHVIVGAGVPGQDIGYYIGGMSKVELQQGANKRFVLATYGMCSEGTDYPHWDVLAMLTPRANVEQAVGRVIRTKEGKPQPIVFDMIDHDGIFNTFFTSRCKTYYKLGADICPM